MPIIHPKGYKFGNSAPSAVRSGSSYLQIENYLSKGAAPPPTSIVWNWAIAWGMALNDRIGCCVVAARAHEVTNATYQTAGLAQYVPDPDVLTAYEAISGYSPNVPGSDVGCDPVAAEKYFLANPIAGHTLSGYAVTNPASMDSIRYAIQWFRACKLAITIPANMNFLTPDGQQLLTTWDLQPQMDFSVQGAGHDVLGIGYDATGVYAVSWGAVYLLTWAFVAKVLSTGIAAITSDFLTAQGTTPAGLNMAALTTDLASLQESTTQSWLDRFLNWWKVQPKGTRIAMEVIVPLVALGLLIYALKVTGLI